MDNVTAMKSTDSMVPKVKVEASGYGDEKDYAIKEIRNSCDTGCHGCPDEHNCPHKN